MILDLRPVTAYTDFFVLATGRNARQTKAIYDEVRERMKADERARPRAVEGEREGNWIVADYLDVVVHVFTPETREYYRLEDLWGDMPSFELGWLHFLGHCANRLTVCSDGEAVNYPNVTAAVGIDSRSNPLADGDAAAIRRVARAA